MTVGNCGGGGISRGLVLFHERRSCRGRRGRNEGVSYLRRGVNTKSALERVSGIDVGDVSLGHVGTVQEYIHSPRQ